MYGPVRPTWRRPGTRNSPKLRCRRWTWRVRTRATPDASSLCRPSRLNGLLASLAMPARRPGSTSPGRVKNGMPTSPNSPLVKQRTEMTGRAIAAPMKSFSPRCAPPADSAAAPRGRRRPTRRGRRRTACAGSPASRWNAASALAASTSSFSSSAPGGLAEGALVAAGQRLRPRATGLATLRGAARHLARIEDRPDGSASTARSAAPSQPNQCAIAHVPQAGRAAVELDLRPRRARGPSLQSRPALMAGAHSSSCRRPTGAAR